MTITEKAITSHIDAVWHGYVRSRFAVKIAEILNDPATETLYLTVKKSKGPKEERFVRELEQGNFIGKVCWHTIRTNFGD